MFLITILDIIYTNFIYIILSIITGVAIDRLYGVYNQKKYEKMHISMLVFDITFHIIFLSLILFVCRHLVLNVFSPLSAIKGYDRSNLFQLNNATVFTAMLFVFQNNLMGKIGHLHVRMNEYYKV